MQLHSQRMRYLHDDISADEIRAALITRGIRDHWTRIRDGRCSHVVMVRYHPRQETGGAACGCGCATCLELIASQPYRHFANLAPAFYANPSITISSLARSLALPTVQDCLGFPLAKHCPPPAVWTHLRLSLHFFQSTAAVLELSTSGVALPDSRVWVF